MKNNSAFTIQVKCFAIFILAELPFLSSAALFSNDPLTFFTLNLLAGVLSWTYLEYHLHRFWTHNKKADSTREAFKRHVHHHKHPTEIKVTGKQRLVLFSLSAVLFTVAALWNNYFTILTGFAIGFAWSFFSHWILHQSWSKKIFPHLHRFHIHHHCKYPEHCFGFSTILWDLVFRTTPPRNAAITDRIIQFYYGQH